MSVQNCEHEIDWSIPVVPPPKDAKDQRWMEPVEPVDVRVAREAATYVYCKKCGCKGMIVDDTGNFWDEDGDGNYY
jgi:hypothetical protein